MGEFLRVLFEDLHASLFGGRMAVVFGRLRVRACGCQDDESENDVKPLGVHLACPFHFESKGYVRRLAT